MKINSARAKLKAVTGSEHSSIMQARTKVMFRADAPFCITFTRSGRTREATKDHLGYALTITGELNDGLIADVLPATAS